MEIVNCIIPGGLCALTSAIHVAGSGVTLFYVRGYIDSHATPPTSPHLIAQNCGEGPVLLIHSTQFILLTSIPYKPYHIYNPLNTYLNFPSHIATMPLFHRITLFKIPSESDVDAVLHSYDILKETNRKVCPSSSIPSPFPSTQNHHNIILIEIIYAGSKVLHHLLHRLTGRQHVRVPVPGLHGGSAVDLRVKGGC